ncbi:MAG: hypothetical protein OEW56_12505 [Gemmatimonadota bacterium]|nr:hypothetical protein [Gemmatimonadota bacterium]
MFQISQNDSRGFGRTALGVAGTGDAMETWPLYLGWSGSPFTPGSGRRAGA